jgi:hypothetical protein
MPAESLFLPMRPSPTSPDTGTWTEASALPVQLRKIEDNMKTFRLAAGLAVFVSSAHGADFFPLRQGNLWACQNPGTGELVTVSVGSPLQFQNRAYHVLRGYTAQSLLVRLNERSDLVQVDEETGRASLLDPMTALREE